MLNVYIVTGEYCSDLQRLDLTGVDITDISLKNLAKSCTTLRKLWLRRCIQITDNGLV